VRDSKDGGGHTELVEGSPSRGRECLDFYERIDVKDLATRDRISLSPQIETISTFVR